MKLFTGWIMSAGVILAAASANAQMQAPSGAGNPRYVLVSDFDGPSAAMPPGAVERDGPRLLPAMEVYTVVRENGFSPLGTPHQHGFVYTIAVIDRGGDDGRLVIDARDGRIIRFVPAYRMGANFYDGPTGAYGPAGPLPPVSQASGVPRPPALIPRVASRMPSAVPLPRETPPHVIEGGPESKPLAAKPTPAPERQSAANQLRPADTPPAPALATPGTAEAKPSPPQILPTQEMPKVQGFE